MIITKSETKLSVKVPVSIQPAMEERYDLSLEEGEEVIEDEFGTYVAKEVSDIDANIGNIPYPIIIDPEGNVGRSAHAGDAGIDLTAREASVVPAHSTQVVPTGFHLGLMPYDHVALVCSRSGLSTKGIWVANAPGVVDSGYEDEIKVILHNSSDSDFSIEVGDRIAQVIVVRCLPFLAFSGERGKNGLGSTGMEANPSE